MRVEIAAAGSDRMVELRGNAGRSTVLIDGREREASWAAADEMSSLILDGRSYEISIVEAPDRGLTVYVNGRPVPVVIGAGVVSGFSRTGVRSNRTGSIDVIAPMPGRVVRLLVRTGDHVAERQPLVVVEAMKMENELRSPKAGIVTDVRVAEGASVEARAVLMVVE